jgi:hypothetical protein
VTAEHIRHLKSRVEQFEATVAVAGTLKEMPKCKESFSTWLLTTAAQWATGDVAAPLLLQRSTADLERINGLAAFCETAGISDAIARGLAADMEELGAIRVSELTEEDWRGLPSWSELKKLQQRRIMQLL